MRSGFVRRIGGGMPATWSRSLCLPLGLALVAIFGAPESRAQTAKYPDRPVKMLGGFAAGGGTGGIARIVAQKMSEGLGQTVLGGHRPGASGSSRAVRGIESAPAGGTG